MFMGWRPFDVWEFVFLGWGNNGKRSNVLWRFPTSFVDNRHVFGFPMSRISTPCYHFSPFAFSVVVRVNGVGEESLDLCTIDQD